MNGSQQPADDHGAQKGHIGNSLEDDPCLAGGDARLFGKVLGGFLHVLQRWLSRRMTDAACPAHARAFPRERGSDWRDSVFIPPA